MQLLQRWFQTFEQPIVSAAQQTAMLATLDADNFSAKDANRDMDAKQPAAGDLILQHELHGAATRCSTEACAAAFGHMPKMQSVIIDRIIECIEAVTEQDQDGSSRQVLMQWLAKALTKPQQLGISSLPSVEQQALLRALEHYASHGSSSTVQTLHAPPFEPALIGLVETAAENVATSDGFQTQAVVNDMDACATAEAPLSMPAESEGSSYNGNAAHMPSTSVGVGRELHVTGKPDVEVEHSVENGCMWFHQRVAKVSIGRFR